MTRWLRYALDLLLVGLVGFVGWEVGAVIAQRFTFGYDLEWMEGATLLTGLRAAEGLPFYTEPTPDYIPFIYPPLYAWVLGVLGQFVPVGYELGRAVSIAGSLAAAGALVYAARVVGARWSWAIGCAGLFVGAYDDGGTFYDLVRTDGLAIGLLGWSLALSSKPGRGSAAAGGLLLAVAFAAKHHSAMWGLPVAIVLWRRDGLRAGLTYGLCAAVPAVLFVGAMQLATGGLFLTWLLGVPSAHGMVTDRLLPWVKVLSWSPLRLDTGGAGMEILQAYPITIAAAFLLPGWMRSRPYGLYWAVVSLVALVTVSIMRGHTGGYVNVLIPMLWAAALWPALVAQRVTERWAWAEWLVPVVIGAQLLQGRGDYARSVPTEADRANAAAMIEELRALPEPMLIPHAPYYAVLAGKEPAFALICLWDIDHDGSPMRYGVRRVDQAMKAQRWATIVLPDDKLGHKLKEAYRQERTLKSKGFPTRTGWGVRLRQIWVPDPAKAPPAP